VKIRRAVVGDEHTLAALNPFVHDMHHGRRPDYYKTTRVDEVAAWFRERLENPLPALWIAEEGGIAVGYVVAFFHERPENPFRQARRWCEIDQIAVDPAYRRRGVGRMLMSAALDEARARGLSDVELSSWAFNTDAHALFRRLGFEPRVVTFERGVP
jgi:ribosomal protein S18 acetylase RimI-like enzyme